MTIGYSRIDTLCESRISYRIRDGGIKARRNPSGASRSLFFSKCFRNERKFQQVMYVDKALLTIILCTSNAWCSVPTLTWNARTFDASSFFAWSQALLGNRPDVSIFPRLWPSRPQLQEWTRSGIANLLRLTSFISTGKEPMHIEFRPEDGPRAAKAYQRRFGYRGEWLIKQLGNGLDPDIRPVTSAFPMLPLTPFRRGNNLVRNSASILEYNR